MEAMIGLDAIWWFNDFSSDRVGLFEHNGLKTCHKYSQCQGMSLGIKLSVGASRRRECECCGFKGSEFRDGCLGPLEQS